MKDDWEQLAGRLKNFYMSKNNTQSTDELVHEQEVFYKALYDFKEKLVLEIKDSDLLSKPKSKLVAHILGRYFEWFISLFQWKDFLLYDMNYIENCFKTFIFITLCQFMDRSKKFESITLKKFVLTHSDTPAVTRKCDEEWSKADHEDAVKTDGEALRKMRNRLFKKRDNYYDRIKWSFMSASSEWEWSLYYKTSQNKHIQDTLKKYRNLYNEVNAVLRSNSPVGDEYDKFLKKLSRIKLSNHVELCKEVINHISSDKSYYGINLYRFERELRYSNMAFEIKEYLKQTEDDREEVIRRFYQMQNIVSPILYTCIYPLFIVNGMHVDQYLDFYNILEFIGIEPCLLILDEFVEKNYLGDNWQNLFREITNCKAQEVLYDPETVMYNINSESQEAFEQILSGLVKIRLEEHDKKVNSSNASAV